MTTAKQGGASAARAHQQSASSIVRELLLFPSKAQLLFRGLPVVLILAVPARIVYIDVLENSREGVGEALTRVVAQAEFGPDKAHAFVATVLGGAARGLAAVSAQMLIVPIGVISQRQMVMNDGVYRARGLTSDVARSVVPSAAKGGRGWRGLYAGFGLSVFSSLPMGSVWWATYGGCQAWMRYLWPNSLSPPSEARGEGSAGNDSPFVESHKRATMQLASGLGAAVVALSLTMPLDTIKTQLQVKGETKAGASYMEVTAH